MHHNTPPKCALLLLPCPLQAAAPTPFALFGSRPTTPQQQEEEEEVQVSAAPALPFANLFGAKQAPVQVGRVVFEVFFGHFVMLSPGAGEPGLETHCIQQHIPTHATG